MLDDGRLIQIDLHHDEDGKRYATVYGVGFKLQSPEEIAEAREEAMIWADEVEVISE